MVAAFKLESLAGIVGIRTPNRSWELDMAKTVKRREWTKDDVRELKSLARQKTPVAKIAKSLKRTPGATQQKAFTLGVSLDSRA
jgi:hypothetical protein